MLFIRFPSETLFPELARALNDAVSRIGGKAPRARHGETAAADYFA